MNTQRLLDIIAYIEKHPNEYDQDSYISECGKKYCIAGFAHLAYDIAYPGDGFYDTVDMPLHTFAKAIDYLGISTEEGDYLFCPYRTLEEIREFAETGEFWWHDTD